MCCGTSCTFLREYCFSYVLLNLCSGTSCIHYCTHFLCLNCKFIYSTLLCLSHETPRHVGPFCLVTNSDWLTSCKHLAAARIPGWASNKSNRSHNSRQYLELSIEILLRHRKCVPTKKNNHTTWLPLNIDRRHMKQRCLPYPDVRLLPRRLA